MAEGMKNRSFSIVRVILRRGHVLIHEAITSSGRVAAATVAREPKLRSIRVAEGDEKSILLELCVSSLRRAV